MTVFSLWSRLLWLVWLAGGIDSTDLPRLSSFQVGCEALSGCQSVVFESDPLGELTNQICQSWNPSSSVTFHSRVVVTMNRRWRRRNPSITPIPWWWEVGVVWRVEWIDLPSLKVMQGCDWHFRFMGTVILDSSGFLRRIMTDIPNLLARKIDFDKRCFSYIHTLQTSSRSITLSVM